MSGDLERSPLWLILVEVVHSLPMYRSHKAYVRDHLLLENPELTPEELSQRLDIPLGEAMVILSELRGGLEEAEEEKGEDEEVYGDGDHGDGEDDPPGAPPPMGPPEDLY